MKRGGSVSGAVSLVMIFCVLCLAVFSALALATADREARLAELTAQRAADYYEADRRAVEIVEELLAGETPAEVRLTPSPEGTEASFSLPAGGELVLEVRVLLTEEGYAIQRWATAYAGGWEADDTITIWDGF